MIPFCVAKTLQKLMQLTNTTRIQINIWVRLEDFCTEGVGDT